MSRINESLGALKALGSPNEQWDHIIVYILSSRLDPETHEAWEIHLGNSTDPPTLKDLQSFIDGRARALEGIELRELSRPGTYTSKHYQGNHQKAKVHSSSVDHQKPKFACLLCNENHYLSNCNAFAQKSPFHRKEYLIAKNLCFNCLGAHLLRDCRSQKCCQKCKKRHHTMIHEIAGKSFVENELSKGSKLIQSSPSHTNTLVEGESSIEETVATTYHATPQLTGKHTYVLLATAQVKVISPKQDTIIARALIDQGSELSFISENLVQSLRLPRKPASISLIGVGGNQSAVTRGQVTVTLGSIHDSNIERSISACILPKLTSLLPSTSLPLSNWPHINGLELADPSFMKPGSVDLILGADVYVQIILSGLIKGPPLTPIAQSTIFGWTLSGPQGNNNYSKASSMYHCVSHEDVDRQLERFWLQEEVSEKKEPVLSTDGHACEEFFKSSFKRYKSGRYEVRLPLKESSDVLGESYSSSLKILKSTEPRLSSNS